VCVCSSLDLQSQIDLEGNNLWEWKVAELARVVSSGRS
jgi:hypothetical protein